MPTNTMKVEKARALATIAPSTWNAEKRTIDVIVSTGAAVRRYDWWNGGYYDEELVIEEGAIRMDRLNAGAAVLNTHGQWELGDQIGVVERAWIEGGKLMATLRLSAREDIAGIVQDIADGIIRNISVGYIPHVYETIENAGQKIPTKRAIDWEPTEVSFVPVPADPGAQARSQQPNLYTVEVRTRDAAAFIPPAAPSGTTQEETRTMDENEQQPQGGAAATAPTDEQIRAAAKAERTRIAEITKAVRAAGLDEAFGIDLIDRGVALDEARALVINKMAEKDAETPTRNVNPAASVRVTQDETDTRRRAMEIGLTLRANPRAEVTPEEAAMARRYRGLTLIEMAREAVRSAGGNPDGMSRDEVASAALNMTRAGSMSTSDFPYILANVANNSLRQGYEAAPQTFRPLVREVSASDFKDMYRTQLGEAPRLEKVNEGGEFKTGTMSEARESYKLATYGKIIAVTRQVIINDDLGAFTRVPELFGRAAADLESDTVWGILTANAAMADGVALFHATHANVGTAGAISVTTLAEARKLMRLQKGLDEEQILNLLPRYLVVPAALEAAAEQYLTSTQVIYAKSSDVNPFAGKMQLITEPRLDANSSTAWYVAADPGQIDMIEIAYLEGQRGVYIETREGFEVDGLQIKARLDFGAKAIDHRGLVKNAGQ